MTVVGRYKTNLFFGQFKRGAGLSFFERLLENLLVTVSLGTHTYFYSVSSESFRKYNLNEILVGKKSRRYFKT